ncbi:PP2C family protein-serine/threonine phosphatase [Desulfosediminicola sp.]|uniref:PP2C family protein-serine/threonine phosphatase n=1 Tax=Desulfosediminicola sp. TaxID=2886825 RepID=UPI003AF2E71F
MKQYIAYADKQIEGARLRQEDSLLVVEHVKLAAEQPGTLLLICDGMGGHTSGGLASKLVTSTIARTFHQTHGTIPQRLKSAAESANAAIASRIVDDPRLNGMGTTLVAAFISDWNIYWYSVGDSSLWLIRNNRLRRLNEDHSMAAMLDKQHKRDELSTDTEYFHGRHFLMSAINGKVPDIVDCPSLPFTLQEGDQLLLATDGIETLSLSRLNEILTKTSQLPVAGSLDAIFEEIKFQNHPQQDNASAILVRIGSGADIEKPQLSRHSTLLPGRLKTIRRTIMHGVKSKKIMRIFMIIAMIIIAALIIIRLIT